VSYIRDDDIQASAFDEEREPDERLPMPDRMSRLSIAGTCLDVYPSTDHRTWPDESHDGKYRTCTGRASYLSCHGRCRLDSYRLGPAELHSIPAGPCVVRPFP
jgi:hypothetical protein